MTREEFLKLMGFGTLAAASLYCFGGCTSGSTTPDNVDFTIDISQSPNDDLQEVGKYLIKNGVIIAHVAQGSYIAVSAACTHEGTNIEYKSAQNIFHCPNHDSEFKTDGSVQKGPAKKSLTQYNVTVNGNIIRVFS
jgi:cytochrome b6-f complex iron-sulfur subunit